MMPAIADHLPISLRAYAEASKARMPRRDMGASSWSLIFDTETTTDAAQSLRFGTYQLRDGCELREAGLFFDPAGVSAEELAMLRSFTEREGQTLRTRDEFVDEVFFGCAYQLRARIIGFNLPFDMSRIAIRHGAARDSMYGGFTFTLSHQKIWPHLRVKHLSRTSSLISFAAPYRQRDSRGERKREIRTPVRRGYFVDVNTLAAALLSQGFTLGRLSAFLKVEHPKIDFDEFDRPISDEILAYAVRDTQTTWECYCALLDKLDRLGMPDLRPEQIYSEAGVGKGYLDAMGIAPWRISQPDFPPEMLGRIMATYYGGRSEIRIRREARQVMLCDFLSMYPTVCTLMGLWKFAIADGMAWRDATPETEAFLADINLAELQSPATWPKLATLVRVQPDDDIFPVRAAYAGEAQSTIGLNYISSDTALWFTLADCIASKLLTGKAPRILEAVAFTPGPVQTSLRPINVSGNPLYRVDPTETDFFRRVIELRKETQGRMKLVSCDEREALDTEQHALKICANSTSYGIWVQVNVEARAKAFSATVHGSNGQPFTRETDKAEKPGSYFHPLLASLITGAARLMLAMTECQIEAQGLEWAFCDTDSMAIAKPDTMPDAEFRQRVGAIADWFAGLNPYSFPGSILKIEDENASLETGEPEPLYCWAVSSKRYALFNRDGDGTPILRKVSAHGLGHLRPPYGAHNPPVSIPAPPEAVLRSGVERWHCDLWFEIVSAALAGKPDMPNLTFHPAMNAPSVSRYGATAPELLRWFDAFNEGRPYRDQVKPFGFLMALHARRDWSGEKIIANSEQRGRPAKKLPPKPVAPFDKDPAKVAVTTFDRISGKPIPVSALQTYAEALAPYHLHPESKFLGGDYLDRGTTRRRHVRVSAIRHIGKESNEWEQQAVLGLDDEADIEYGFSDESLAQLRQDLTVLIAAIGKAEAAKALGMPVDRLRRFLRGECAADTATAQIIAARLPAAMQHSEGLLSGRQRELQNLQNLVQLNGLRGAARLLRTDPSNLRRTLTKRQISTMA